ncbi:MAG: hypothetical protein V7604_2325, partial [Hyphomicrobiales bacterium]
FGQLNKAVFAGENKVVTVFVERV